MPTTTKGRNRSSVSNSKHKTSAAQKVQKRKAKKPAAKSAVSEPSTMAADAPPSPKLAATAARLASYLRIVLDNPASIGVGDIQEIARLSVVDARLAYDPEVSLVLRRMRSACEVIFPTILLTLPFIDGPEEPGHSLFEDVGFDAEAAAAFAKDEQLAESLLNSARNYFVERRAGAPASRDGVDLMRLADDGGPAGESNPPAASSPSDDKDAALTSPASDTAAPAGDTAPAGTGGAASYHFGFLEGHGKQIVVGDSPAGTPNAFAERRKGRPVSRDGEPAQIQSS